MSFIFNTDNISQSTTESGAFESDLRIGLGSTSMMLNHPSFPSMVCLGNPWTSGFGGGGGR